MRKLSVVIITFNETENIARCISSARELADEIIVLDSFSSDSTAEIARSMGARVEQAKFRGYIAQKNAAIQIASNDLILSLDADEALDKELGEAIEKAKQDETLLACSMNRCTNYCGKFIRHGLWYPDKKLRLFDRRIAAWGGLDPHDKIKLAGKIPVKHLPGNILHYSFSTTEDLIWQNNRLSTIAANSLYAAGRKTNFLRILIHPLWAFFNGYILRRGFLDGYAGWSIAIHSSYQVFMKHSKWFELQKRKNRGQGKIASLPPVSEKQSSIHL